MFMKDLSTKMDNSKAKASLPMLRELTKDSLLMDRNMDTAFIFTRRSFDTRECILTTKSKVKENCSTTITLSLTRDLSKMECHMEKELRLLKMAVNFKLNGLMELMSGCYDYLFSLLNIILSLALFSFSFFTN